MKTLQAKVVGGRLVMDKPTRLPEGKVLNLVLADEGDDLDAEERAALHAELSEGWAELQAGKRLPAKKLLEDAEGEDLE